ncbi:MAG: site-specific integrase [Candidatus Cyclobacteriaceae bacterium M2_1C_046]
MRSNHTFSILFFLKASRNKNEGFIFARITVDGRRAEISLKRKIERALWNSEKGNVKGNKEESKMLNKHIDEVQNKLYDCYNELIKEGKLPTAQAVKDVYTGKEDREHTLMGLIRYHNQNHGKILSWGSLKNYKTSERYMEEFLEEKYKTKDIYLKQLSFKFLKDFEYWLREDRPCNNNTVLKHIVRLRKIIRIAVSNDWIPKDPFANFKGQYTKSDREFLLEEELQTISNKVFEDKHLDEVRDAFVFSCYTGMSYADLVKLTIDDLGKGIDGEIWIFTKRTKTAVTSNVPLLPKGLEIIEKYSEHIDRVNDGRLIPLRSNQKMNKNLKTIATECEIKKNLTFHMARHTFATTVTLTNGVPIESVSSMLGHTSIKTTQIYAKVIESKVSQDMKKLKDLMGGSSAPDSKAVNQ